MRSLNLSPDVYSYNLLLRCVKSCGAGDPQLTYKMLDGDTADVTQREKTENKLKSIRQRVILIGSSQTPDLTENDNIQDTEANRKDPEDDLWKTGSSSEQIEQKTYKMIKVTREVPETVDQDAMLPSLLGKTLRVGKVVGLGPLDQPHDR